MKILSPLNNLERIQKQLGYIPAVFTSSVLLFFYGTLISACLLIAIDFCEWETEPFWDIPVGILSLLIAACITWNFSRTSAFFANNEFLPHLLNRKQGKRSIIIGVPLLLIAAIIQLLIYEFDPYDLIFTLIQLTCIFYAIACFALAVQWLNIQRSIRQKRLMFLFGFTAMFVLSILFTSGCILALVYYPDFSLFVNFLVLVVVVIIFLLVKYYYTYIASELAVNLDQVYLSRPSAIKAVVLLSKFNKPTIRAISFAKALHDNVEIVSICIKDNGEKIVDQWKRIRISVPLRLHKPQSPDFVTATADYIRSIHIKSSRELVVIYLPHYTSRHRFEGFLHNQLSRGLVHELDKIPNVVISSVPWSI